MRTKAYHSFESKLQYFEDDIELIDVLRLNIEAEELTEVGSKKVLKKVDTKLHKHLSRRQNSAGSRTLIINHLRTTVYSAYIKDVYEEVTHYLRTILEQAAENGFDSGRIIGEHGLKIDAREVLKAGDWSHVAKLITNSVFQALESEKSTLKLFEKIANKLALTVDTSLINDALPYLEVRHLLVHSDGRASQEFKSKYKKIAIKDDCVVINYKLVTKARDAVKLLIEAIDKEVINNDLVAGKYTQP